MMLGVPASLMGGGASPMAAAREPHESGGASGGSSEVGGTVPAGGGVGVTELESGGGRNRWPRQETLALLKIRSDMGAAFRDANLKGPLWEDVSRKMAELGFRRSDKKCKEKFENVYKYHKRTKDSRASKPDSKSYRFFDQLEAFETTAAPLPPIPNPNPTALQIPSSITVSASTSPTPLSMVMTQNNQANNPYSLFKQSQPPPSSMQHQRINSPFQAPSDEDAERRQRGSRKRKWKEYFGKMMREVVQRQEELQNNLLDALERAERDRTAREETWRAQETARMRRERDLLVRERSMTEAKDTAVIAFIKKMTNEPNFQVSTPNNHINVQHQHLPVAFDNHNQPTPPIPTQPTTAMLSPSVAPRRELEIVVANNGDGFIQASSSRWPKAEVEALIKLRTNLDTKYQENGPKGPLWEDISVAMAKLGYSRNPKRCKEKWENINKYYKKVKESNRKRPEDSKTCPYFQLLEEIYKDKAIHNFSGFAHGHGLKPDDPMAPIRARPEQQWPSAEHRRDPLPINDNDQSDQNNEDDEDEDDDEDENNDAVPYDIIADKPRQPSPVANTAE